MASKVIHTNKNNINSHMDNSYGTKFCSLFQLFFCKKKKYLHLHKLNGHAGANQRLAAVHQEYWVILPCVQTGNSPTVYGGYFFSVNCNSFSWSIFTYGKSLTV